MLGLNKKFAPFLLIILVLFSSCENEDKRVEEERIFTAAFASKPKTINPFFYSNSNENFFVSHIFQTLLKINASSDGLSPILAKSIPELIEEDGKYTITYTIKQEAKWADGEPVKPEDILNSYKILFNPYSDLQFLRDYFYFIEDIEILNDSTLKFTCDEYDKQMIFKSGDLDIVDSRIFDPQSVLSTYTLSDLKSIDIESDSITELVELASQIELNTLLESEKISGSGPFMITEIDQDAGEFKFELQENWWGNQNAYEEPRLNAYLDEFLFKVFEDKLTQTLAIQNKDVDLAHSLSSEEVVSVMENPNAQLFYTKEQYPIYYHVFLVYNNETSVGSNIHLKKAISHLCNTPLFIDNFLQGNGIQVHSMVSPYNGDIYNSHLKSNAYSIEMATELLSKAGFVKEGDSWQDKNGDPLVLNMPYQAGNRNSEDYALFLQSQLREVGIELKLNGMEFSTFIQSINNGEFDIARMVKSTTPIYYDYFPIFHSESIENGRNHAALSIPSLDSLIEKLNQETDRTEQIKIHHDIQKIIFEDYSYTFLYSPLGNSILNQEYEGFNVLPGDAFPWMGTIKKKELE